MDPTRALAQWGRSETNQTAPDEGLINHTWVVGDPPTGVLQWVNPIFSPEIHRDIALVTGHLSSHGIPTPCLLPTLTGELYWVDQDGCWRLQSFVPGSTHHAFSSSAQAASAASLVGRFHAALTTLNHDFPHQRKHAHDTPSHMANLRETLDSADGHPLEGPARALGQEILSVWETWDGPLDLPERICHGDLKVSNIRMDPTGQTALCLLDLDTLGRLPYSVELGDAWRSWCNPAPEDDFLAVRFDMEIFTATAQAWLAHAPAITKLELGSLVPGVERICLELAARFCADAVANCYFREDTSRFPQPGTQNLAKAKTQRALAAAARSHRSACEAVVQSGAQGRPIPG